MGRRWGKIEKDFCTKNKTYDISKIPDIYDCIKYDLQHNQHTLQFDLAEELYIYAKYLADIVIPQVSRMMKYIFKVVMIFGIRKCWLFPNASQRSLGDIIWLWTMGEKNCLFYGPLVKQPIYAHIIFQWVNCIGNSCLKTLETIFNPVCGFLKKKSNVLLTVFWNSLF